MAEPDDAEVPPEVAVQDVPDRRRFEASVDGHLAGFLRYTRHGDVLRLIHTEVDDAYEGRGVGGALARTALDAARSSGDRVEPICPFVQSWLTKHPEYADVVGSSN